MKVATKNIMYVFLDVTSNLYNCFAFMLYLEYIVFAFDCKTSGLLKIVIKSNTSIKKRFQ